jgi:3-oxoacyl-[acyl-carrier protein] reductase
LEQAGRVDILVNNAGVTRDGLLMRMSEADWDAVLNTNLRGAFLFTKGFTRAFLKQRSGRVINIASVIGLIGNAGQCNLRGEQGRPDRFHEIGGQGIPAPAA